MQLALFGWALEGTSDALVGFVRGKVPVAADDTLNAGLSHYENAAVTGHVDDRIEGTTLEMTDVELVHADAYEAPAAYVRIAVTLESGTTAWVYVHGPSRPPE